MKDYTDFDALREIEAIEKIVNPPWLREMRAIEEIVTSPVMRQMKAAQDMTRQMKAFQDMVNPPWLRKSKEFQDMLHPPAIRQLKGIHDNLWAAAAIQSKSFFPHIDSNNITSALSAVASSPLGRTIDMVARKFPSRSMLASGALSVLAGLKLQHATSGVQLDRNSPFVSSLAALQDTLEASEDADDGIQRLLEAVEAIYQKLEALVQTSKSKYAVVSFIALVISLLIPVYYGQRQEHREVRSQHAADERDKMIQDSLGKIVELLKQARGTNKFADTKAIRFCVDTAVNVREYQDNRSRRLALLPRGAVVEVDEVSRDWLRVELPDHVNGTVRHGWARKKYLSRCKN